MLPLSNHAFHRFGSLVLVGRRGPSQLLLSMPTSCCYGYRVGALRQSQRVLVLGCARLASRIACALSLRVSQAAVEAPTAQPEAQVNAQQSARNDTPDAYQVGLEQAVHDTSRTPRKITQEQLRAQLDAYYAGCHFMGPVIAMACLQVLPMTGMVFHGMFLDKTNVDGLIIGFMFKCHLRPARQYPYIGAVGGCGECREHGAIGRRGQFKVLETS